MTDSPPISLDGTSLTVDEVAAVARDGRRVAVTESAREAVRAGRERVESVLDAGDAVYGLNTGFGDLVDTRIPPDEVDDLQTNLIRSHAAGTGRDLSREEVRALLVVRLNTLLRGYSGVREVVVDHLLTLVNHAVHPVVRSRGSLGASGDLAPLAHLSLVLLGEGEADVEGGSGTERVSGAEALRRVGLDPLTLRAKEGLALINGTQLTTGLAALAVFDAERLLRAADAAGALTTEVTMGSTAACDPAIHDLRPHPGQSASARNVKRLTRDSEIVESHRNCDRVQDAYSIRCLPQVHGAARDAVSHLREAVAVELNAVTDNPIVFPREALDARASGTDTAAVVSGGNFHGAPLAHRLDSLTAALTDLAAISERRVDRTLNPSVQESHLPPFLSPDSGVRSGYMIPQYTAAALLAECRSEGRPATDSTPVSGGQEDHVSMSATSALATRRTLDRARRVVSVELLCAAQAAEFVDGLNHGVGTGAVYDAVRAVVPPLDEDRPSHGDIDALAALVGEGRLDSVLFDVVDDVE
ncbi:histidine ammonia-lyase [Salinigranum rubrum]|uniref:Probable histidine ammonia-lyase n=1 Tax=Salinigranum rubrum TaxID=755307 RepID=A0A2I8VEQ1_9EURY|nr:histidine ammonia-lyase [Salinigranum rubrum]AUV80408.1 histidine ammonia-lyase [Salinigranum rubrum]